MGLARTRLSLLSREDLGTGSREPRSRIDPLGVERRRCRRSVATRVSILRLLVMRMEPGGTTAANRLQS